MQFMIFIGFSLTYETSIHYEHIIYFTNIIDYIKDFKNGNWMINILEQHTEIADRWLHRYDEHLKAYCYWVSYEMSMEFPKCSKSIFWWWRSHACI